jgi:hypothetical protein
MQIVVRFVDGVTTVCGGRQAQCHCVGVMLGICAESRPGKAAAGGSFGQDFVFIYPSFLFPLCFIPSFFFCMFLLPLLLYFCTVYFCRPLSVLPPCFLFAVLLSFRLHYSCSMQRSSSAFHFLHHQTLRRLRTVQIAVLSGGALPALGASVLIVVLQNVAGT